MSVMQISDEKVMIFGGHTDPCISSEDKGQIDQTAGPNKEIQIVDLTAECLKSRFGLGKLQLPDSSTGGKTYFPPCYDSKTGIVSLIFGYCDQAPVIEDFDLS